jgi:hypothetical protein
MIQIIIKKTVLKQLAILFLLAISINGYSQEITEPAFVYKDEKNPKLSTLYNFINYNVYDAYDDNCFKGSGTVRFLVLKNGFISNLEITGNLPEVLQNYIKRKIHETEGKWIFKNKKTETSKWFVFMYYLNYHVATNCAKSNKDEILIAENYTVINQLFMGYEQPIETPTSYLFRPISMTAYR